MKVAVTLFREGISPRVDITDSLLIYHIKDNKITKQETCCFSFEQPSELAAFLQEKNIEKIICGGCPQYYLRMLHFYCFDVVHGVSGNPGHIIQLLIDGKLDSLQLSQPCRRQRRGRSWSDFTDAAPRAARRDKRVKKN